jgi:hypothetical protein
LKNDLYPSFHNLSIFFGHIYFLTNCQKLPLLFSFNLSTRTILGTKFRAAGEESLNWKIKQSQGINSRGIRRTEKKVEEDSYSSSSSTFR